MLPVFLDLGVIKIYTFGVFLILAFFWASYLLWRNFRLTVYKEDDIFDTLFATIGGAIVGGRLLYVILNFSDFGLNILKILLINGYPGISIYGAIIGGLVTLALMLSSKKIHFFDVIDYYIAPLFVGMGFGKVGSFFSGAEVGTKTRFPLSIHYAGFGDLRHLTAFYEGLLFFVGAFIAYRLLFAIRREEYKKGLTFYVFLVYFGFVTLLFDKLKEFHLYLFGQSFNLVVSVVVLVISTPLLIYQLRSGKSFSLSLFKSFSKRHGHHTTSETVHSPTTEETGTTQN